jgi:hypothetical protein
VTTTDDQSMFRELRAAKNQALFRDVNERIEPVNEAFGLIDAHGNFICECANDTCIEQISVSISEYEAVRREPTRFFVAPNDEHVWPDVEVIVEKTDRYWVVEKVGVAGSTAAELDPRV